MGNNISAFQSTSINQTQIAQSNQTCNQGVTAFINGVQITAIDSHIGDITLSNVVSVGNFSCVLSDTIQSQAISSVNDSSAAEIVALPFQANINNISSTQLEDIQSFQQSLINQTCTETDVTVIGNINLTFIDSTTGNIKISNGSSIDSFSCNLTAITYQTASATVTNAASAKISDGCCLFDFGMLIPVVLGLVGLIVVSKMVGPKSGAGGAGGESAEQTQGDLIAKLSGQALDFQKARGPQSSGAMGSSAISGGSGRGRRSLPTVSQGIPMQSM